MIKWIVAGVLIAGVIAFFAVSSYKKEKEMEAETLDFVTDTVSAISKEWNPHALAKRAEPGLLRAMAGAGQSIDDLFGVYRKLGSLRGDPDCHLKDTSEFGGTGSSYTTASYSCDAQYDNGPATLLITLRNKSSSDEWKVYYLNVSSPYFTESGYQRTK